MIQRILLKLWNKIFFEIFITYCIKAFSARVMLYITLYYEIFYPCNCRAGTMQR